jgi:hypothetical protein
MGRAILPLTMLALAAPGAATAGDETRWAQLTVRERVIIRVPRMTPPAPAATGAKAAVAPVKWKERKGPKCIGAQGMAGAMITAPKQVDLVLLGGKRLRAKLNRDCKPLDFYAGFYLRPAKDGMICADRDAIKVRSGASCLIDDFRLLVPDK